VKFGARLATERLSRGGHVEREVGSAYAADADRSPSGRQIVTGIRELFKMPCWLFLGSCCDDFCGCRLVRATCDTVIMPAPSRIMVAGSGTFAPVGVWSVGGAGWLSNERASCMLLACIWPSSTANSHPAKFIAYRSLLQAVPGVSENSTTAASQNESAGALRRLASTAPAWHWPSRATPATKDRPLMFSAAAFGVLSMSSVARLAVKTDIHNQNRTCDGNNGHSKTVTFMEVTIHLPAAISMGRRILYK